MTFVSSFLHKALVPRSKKSARVSLVWQLHVFITLSSILFDLYLLWLQYVTLPLLTVFLCYWLHCLDLLWRLCIPERIVWARHWRFPHDHKDLARFHAPNPKRVAQGAQGLISCKGRMYYWLVDRIGNLFEFTWKQHPFYNATVDTLSDLSTFLLIVVLNTLPEQQPIIMMNRDTIIPDHHHHHHQTKRNIPTRPAAQQTRKRQRRMRMNKKKRPITTATKWWPSLLWQPVHWVFHCIRLTKPVLQWVTSISKISLSDYWTTCQQHWRVPIYGSRNERNWKIQSMTWYVKMWFVYDNWFIMWSVWILEV